MEVTQEYVNQTYQIFATEQMNLMQSLKSSDDEEKSKNIQKQFSLINSIMIQLLRYRNIKQSSR
jgi:hypothetical protein